VATNIDIKEINLPTSLTHAYLVPLSDFHVGDINFDEKKLQGYIDWILANDNAYAILNGDILNTATKESVSDCYTGLRPQEELEKAVKLLLPIKDRILASVSGNHCRRVYKSVGIDFSKLLADRLGCYYAGDEAYLKIKVGAGINGKPIVYTLYATHGHQGGRSVGAKVNAIAKLANTCMADLYCYSHIHTLTAHVDLYLVPDIRTNKMNEIKRTFVSSGAFLKRGGYAVTHGYPASKLGSPRIRLSGSVRDVHVSL
jgi:hypothetical protein